MDGNLNNEKNHEKELTKVVEDNEKIEDTVEVIGKSVETNFIKPVSGKVLKPLSIHELIYSKTLKEWGIHQGTDYEAKIGEEVVAVGNGKIKKIGENDKYGEFIVIEHINGYESLIANITVLDSLKEENTVEKGQLIGYVAESFGFEVEEETHIHFELKKNNKYVSI